jgi:hypothetical protein
MPQTLDDDLAALRGLRIVFGHQSVGDNLLDGLRALMAGHPDALPISELGAPLPAGGGIIHARIGANHDPLSKCTHMEALIDGPLASAVDLALFKLCYVDIDERTDTAALARAYLATLDGLAARHPGLIVVAVTAPLRTVERGWGVWLRERLGRVNRAKTANLARARFNQAVRTGFAGRPLFDLAAAQATRPDGRHEMFRMDGQAVESLHGGYTTDGGHLTPAAARHLAGLWLATLAAAASSRRARP